VVLDAPAYRRGDWQLPGAPPAATRPGQAAEQLAELAARAEPGTRLGTKEELRALCGVSVGTFNEALRLVQARGLVTVRAGRVGGLFASRQSPLVRLGNSVLAIDDDATSVADALDGIEFIHANWALHARIAEVSPSAMLRSFYLSLLEMIESHTLSVQSVADEPLPEYLDNRYRLHADLVTAIEEQDARRAIDIIRVHNAATTGAAATEVATTGTAFTATVPARPGGQDTGA
jgi:DNA-binding FadR family transcriptional regulator